MRTPTPKAITIEEMSRLVRSNGYLFLLEYGFLALLAARSLTELLSSYSFYLGPLTINVSVAAMILMDAVGFAYLAILWIRGEWLFDRIGTYFLVWVLSLAPWVFIAADGFGVPGLTGIREWVRLLSLVLVFFVLYAIARRTNAERVINACLCALPVPLVYAYVELIRNLSSGVSGPAYRVMGSMVHPNILAAFLVAMIALAAWKLIRAIRNRVPLRVRLFWILAIAVQIPPLILTVSSNGWGMLAVFTIAVVAMIPGRRPKAFVGAVIVMLLGAVLWFAASQPTLVSEMAQNLNALGIESAAAEEGGSLLGRFEIWKLLVSEWQRRPLVGFGLNTARFLNPRTGLAAHNDYVRYLVETGAIGLALFVGFLLLVGRRLVARLRHSRGTPHHLLVGVALGVFVAWVFGGIGDNVISYTAFQVYLWALLAAAAASSRNENLLRVLEAHKRAVRQGAAEGSSSPKKTSWRRQSAARAAAVDAPGNPLRGSRNVLLGTFVLLTLSSALITAVGFYLWNRGVTAEAYFLGWMLAYAAVAFVLRGERRAYVRTVATTALIALISVQAQFALPEFALQSAASLSLLVLGLLIVWGAIEAGVEATRREQRPVWNAVPLVFLLLVLVSTAVALIPPRFLPERLPLFAWTFERTTLLRIREIFLEQGGWAVIWAFAGLMLGAGALGATRLSPSPGSGSTRRSAHLMTHLWSELKLIPGHLLHALRPFIRRTLLPLGCLAAMSFALRNLLSWIAAFLDGDRFALACLLGWLAMILVSLSLLTLGISSEGFRRTSRRLGRSWIAMTGVLHLGSLVAMALLWAMSKLLPAFSAIERFAPLHQQRTPGLYTWIALSLSVAFGLVFLVFRRRPVRSTHPGS